MHTIEAAPEPCPPRELAADDVTAAPGFLSSWAGLLAGSLREHAPDGDWPRELPEDENPTTDSYDAPATGRL